MNKLRHLPLALASFAILAAPAIAQRPGGGPGQGGPGRAGGQMGMQGGLIQILSMPPVIEELGLSDEQSEEVRSVSQNIRSEMMSRMQESRERFADLSPEERRERFESISRDLDITTRDQLKDVLKPEQMTRLKQIQLQQQGVRAFGNPSVQEELKLDDEQRSKLDEVLASFQSSSQSLMANARDAQDRGQVMQQLMDLRRSTLDEAMGILSDDQQATWKELTGEPFEMGPGGFGRGRSGPGGGRQGVGGRPGSR